MRDISVAIVPDIVKTLCIKANHSLPKDLIASFHRSIAAETDERARNIFKVLIENAEIAEKDGIAACQDTGVAVVFVRIGQDVHISGGSLEDAINEGVRRGYKEGFLRKSVADPITRKNTGDNTPAVIHYELVPGDSMEITVAPKGFGSENMSQIKMFTPTSGKDAVVDFVVKVVKDAGGNPCPPVLVGVGIGGTFEKSAILSKKALVRPLGQPNARPDIAAIEKEMYDKINLTNIGSQGIGGKITALAVHVDTYPTHIAGLPVAVNICCHAVRHASAKF